MLRAEYPNVYSVKCSCHLIHLASSYAAKMLPKHLEDLCRDIFNHFHRSSKRQDAYRGFQEFFNVEPRQLLPPGQTRWLSLEACVNRILEQYLALQHYFVLTANEDPTHSNDRIVKSLHNKFTLAYLEFLSYQLLRFTAFNRLFHNLKDEVEGLLKSIASDFMVVQYVKETNPKDIDPTNVLHHVPQNQTYIGVAATAAIHEIEEEATNEDLERFRSDCKNFLIERILQIKQRFDLDAEIHAIVQCISPTKAACRTPSSLAQIIQYLSDILDVKKLDQEWRDHSLEDKIKSDLHWDEYWTVVKNAKIPTGESKYPCLIKFVEIIASFPFSNVPVERIFSMLKQIKTDHRTSLKFSSLVSLMQCRMAMKNNTLSAARLTPSKRTLEL